MQTGSSGPHRTDAVTAGPGSGRPAKFPFNPAAGDSSNVAYLDGAVVDVDVLHLGTAARAGKAPVVATPYNQPQG